MSPTHGRPLEDLITDLASGMTELGRLEPGAAHSAGVRPVSVEFDLPVEMRVAGTDDLVVRADVPATRTRTAFDLPLGRLSLTLVAEAVS